MRLKNYILVLIPVLYSLVLLSCVENISDPPNARPTIRVISPASGDTVQIGENAITYEASDYPGGQGLDQFEVVIESENGRYVEVFEATEGNTTAIYLIVDSSLVGTTIDYFVNVRNKDGNYGTSDVQEDLIVVESTSPPEAPSNLVLTKLNTGSVNLFWDDNSTTEEYVELWRKAGANDEFTLYRTLPENTISYNDNGLSELITYFYKVRAGNRYGDSDFSNEVSTIGGEAFNLQAQALGASSILLTWESSEVNILGFRIQRTNPSTGEFEQVAVVEPSAREYTDRNLMAQTSYSYRIASFSSTSQSAWSNIASATTAQNDVPSPTNLTASFSPSQRSVAVQWTDNTDQETGTFIERRVGLSGSFVQIGNTGQDENLFIDSNIVSGNTYYYRARHSTVEGFYTAYSNVDSAFVPVLPPNKPTTLQIYSVQGSSTEFSLVWTDNSNDEDGFQVYRKAGSSNQYTLYNSYPAKSGTGNYGASITVADPNTEYFFKVRAYRDNLYSDFSNEVSTMGSTDQLSINLVSASTDAVIIQWRDVFENELVYEIERKRITFPADEEFVKLELVGATAGSGNIKTYTDTNGVTSNTQYTYRIRAFLNTQEYSNYSNELTVTTPVQ